MSTLQVKKVPEEGTASPLARPFTWP